MEGVVKMQSYNIKDYSVEFDRTAGGSVVKTPVPSDIPADDIKRYKLCGINGKNCSGIIFPLAGDTIKDKPEKIRLQRLRPVEYRAIFTKEQ